MLDSIKILAVDDDMMNLEMLNVMLDELDIEFLKAGNGAEALHLLEAHSDLDLILLDLCMPVMNGYETLEHLKKNPVLRDVPVIVVTASQDEVLKSLSVGANDFLPKPYNPEELRLRVMNHVRTKKLNDLARDMNQILEHEVVKKTSALKKALDFSKATELEISIRLGKAAEFRDLETGMHIRRISELSLLLAKLAGLSDLECEMIHHASPLHDVGKIGIPDRVLLKPGKLEEDEFHIMKTHTQIGGKILSDTCVYPVLEAGKIVAEQHHEKWDGTGYPFGLKGTEIHIFSRILMVVDIFDALTSERPYKKAFSLEKAQRIMEEGRGVFFDPVLLDLFMKNINEFVKIKDDLKDIHIVHEPLNEMDFA